MPFTISHAAAAWPFERTKLVLSAVIVGAMAPDFDYFIDLRFQGRWSHSLPGTFEFSLPAALAVLAVYHALLKRPLVALLPTGVQQRISIAQLKFWPPSRFLLIVASVLTGIATHLLWDSFTHPQGWFVERIAWLQNTHVLWGRNVQNYKFAQHFSTVLGLALLALWFRAWYRSHEPITDAKPQLSARFRVLATASIFGIALVVSLARTLVLFGPHPLHVMFVATDVVIFVSVMVVELLVFGITIRLMNKETRVEE